MLRADGRGAAAAPQTAKAAPIAATERRTRITVTASSFALDSRRGACARGPLRLSVMHVAGSRQA